MVEGGGEYIGAAGQSVLGGRGFVIVPVLRLQFPRVLVGGACVVHTHLPQDLLEVHLCGGMAGAGLEHCLAQDGRWGSDRWLLGLVHQVPEVVVLVLPKGCEEEVQDSLTVTARTLALFLLFLLLLYLRD